MANSFLKSNRRKVLRILAFLVVCLVTLIALFYAVENWRGERAIESLNRDIIARGETLDFGELVPKEIPETENFAVTPTVRQWFVARGNQSVLTNLWPELYAHAASRMPGESEKGERHLIDFAAWQQAFVAVRNGQAGRVEKSGATSTSDRGNAAREVLKTLQVYEPVLDEFRANIHRPAARYPVEYERDAPFVTLLPHLTQLRSVVNVVSLRACAELAAGEGAAAWQDTLLGIRLAESLKNDTLLISQLVRVAMLQSALQPVWEGIQLHRWTPEQLTGLQSKLDAVEFLPDFSRTLSMERAAGMTTIEMARRSRLGDYMNAMGSGDSNGLGNNGALNILGRVLPRGWFYMEAANYARMFDDPIFRAKQEPFDPSAIMRAERDPASKGGLSAVLIHHSVAASVLLPAVGKSSLKFTAGEMAARQAGIACALEWHRLAHGEVPETIDATTNGFNKKLPYDFFARKPMIYRRKAPDSYVLYSVGSNGKDDGGNPGKRMFNDNADWVWKQGL